MNAIDLMESIQRKFVQNETLGLSESIEFTHSTTAVMENTRAFVGALKTNNKANDTIENKLEFANVVLEAEPKANDIIQYDSKVYVVDEDGISKQSGMYFIVASERRQAGGRR